MSKIPINVSGSTSEDSSTDEDTETEEYEDSLEDDSRSMHRTFKDLKRLGVPAEQVEWKLSRWRYLCPVALAAGRHVEGRRKLAVRFTSWIFFLSSLEAREVFLENPRPYLLPPNPRPCCRIAVIGPPYSGRTSLCSELAKKLDSVVVDVRDVTARSTRRDDCDLETEVIGERENSRINEIVNLIVESTDYLPAQHCGDFYRTRGWILDGLELNYELCKSLLENDVHIDNAIILYESEPYENLIRCWTEVQDKITHEKGEGGETCEIDQEDVSESFKKVSKGDLSEYVKKLRYFENNRKLIANKLAGIGIEVILCDLKIIDNLSEHVIPQIYRDFQFTVRSDSLREEYYDEDESSVTITSHSNDRENINFNIGDCNAYCPIALMKHNVLWRGKENYRCFLDDKTYYMSSESALDEFISQDNYKLQLPWEKPRRKVPPLRIFIVGPPGSGKSTLARAISREYGLIDVDFFKHFDEYATSRGVDVHTLKSRLVFDSYEEEDLSLGEEAFEDVELPEKLNDRRYNIDKSVVSCFYLKYMREGGALPPRMANDCVFKYFRPPFDDFGLVVDSFPNYSEDFELCLREYAIPDVIVELECDLSLAKGRLLNDMMAEWRREQNNEIRKEGVRFSEEMEKYEARMKDWIRAEKTKIYRRRKLQECEEEIDFSDESTSEGVSEMSDFSLLVGSDDELDLERTYRSAHPQPERFDDWEDEGQAEVRFSAYIEDRYDTAAESLDRLRELFRNETIPRVRVDGSKTIDEVLVRSLYSLRGYVDRNPSFFEKVQEVDNVTAEALLESGCYLLSSFGRFCPVQLYHGHNPFQMLVPYANRNLMFTVLHRQYVYFLAGEEALASFRSEPLKYLEQDPLLPMLPGIISVIGPPKSGKTNLSNRFASTYSFESVTRDEVLDYALNNFASTELSTAIRAKMQDGEPATAAQLADAVRLFMSNLLCVMQGCVLDGFPSSIEDTEALAAIGIRPIVVLDLDVPPELARENATSACHCSTEYEDWKLDAQEYRHWLRVSFGNLVKIDATKSKAWVWRRADEVLRRRFAQILAYLREFGYDKVYDVEYLCVKQLEIRDRIGRFRLFCPSCVCFDEEFVALDIAEDRAGLVQYREHIYWFCDKHLQAFKDNFKKYLPLFERTELPDSYPQIIHDVVDLNNYCWSSRLANTGYCLVTYVDNLPSRKLVPGKTDLGVLHCCCLHLFCTDACRDKFCRKFTKYSSFRIHFSREMSIPEIRDMPILGYLEQSVAAQVVRAAYRVSELRPKLPGLSAEASAAVYMGTYLKARQGSADSAIYEKALRSIEARCDFLRNTTVNMKKIINPWISLECEKKKIWEERESSMDKGDMKAIPGAQDQLTVKFKRLSASQILRDTDSDSD